MRFQETLRLLILAPAMIVALAPSFALASSHSEAPGMTKDRKGDLTDVYAWVANDATNAVTFVSNWDPLLEPASGPNFYGFDEDAYYTINISNDDDADYEIQYEFRFTTTTQTGATFLYNTGAITALDDPDFNVRQTCTVRRLEGGVATLTQANIPVPPTNIGPKSTPSYNALAQSAVTTLSDGSKMFVGPRDDPFFVDLGSVFDLLTIRQLPGNAGRGVDGVGGFNCMTIAIQVPFTELTKDGMAPSEALDNHVIGTWSTTGRPSLRTINPDGTQIHSGPIVQVSRLGMPLVNEVVIALADKDKFNNSVPADDVANFAGYVVNPEVAVLLNALFGLTVPPTPRTDLVTVFVTGITGLNEGSGAGEMVRLNMLVPPSASPNRIGVIAGDNAGFPNGRRPADDVTDVALRVVAGGYILTPDQNVAPNNQLGDGIDANDMPFLSVFPYIAPPQQGFDHDHHNTQAGAASGRGTLGLGGDSGGGGGGNATSGAGGVMSLLSPNPGKDSALQFTIERDAHVTLKVYDVLGREIRTLVDQSAAAGTFHARWDGRTADGKAAGRGVFFVRLTANGQIASTKKIVLQ